MELSVLQQRLLQGSFAGACRIFLAIPIYLILTPFILDKIGPELFGVWSFSTALTALLNLTDFGMKNSLVFHVAKNSKSPELVNKYFNVAFWIYVALWSLLACVTLVFRSAIVTDLFSIPSKFYDEAAFVVIMTLMTMGVRFLTLPYQAVIDGHQELSRSQLILLYWLFTHFVTSILALTIRPDIYSLAVASLLSNLVMLAGFYKVVRKRYPTIRLSLSSIEKDRLREMALYGCGIHVAAIAITLREPIYKILIAKSFDLSALATFEIVYRLCTQLISVIATPTLGIAAASALLSKQPRDLEQVLRPIARYSLAAVLPIAMCIVTFSPRFAQLWLGPNALTVGTMFPLVFSGFAIYYATEVLYKAIEGSGNSSYSAKIQTAVLTSQVAAFLLLPPNHTWSLPLAMGIGFLLFSLGNYYVFKKSFIQISLVSRWQLVWLLTPSAAYILVSWVVPAPLRGWTFLVYLLVYAVCLRRAGLLDFAIIKGALAAISSRQPAGS